MFEIPKFKHSAPKFELMVLKDPYAITINPIDEFDVKQPLSAWIAKQHRLLSDLLFDCNLTLYLEASPVGRLHFHGTIKIDNFLGYLRTLNCLQKYGTFCIKPIREAMEGSEYESWDAYCKKQSDIWEPYLRGTIYTLPVQFKPAKRLNTILPTESKVVKTKQKKGLSASINMYMETVEEHSEASLK